MNKEYTSLGLMSGTSGDGVDASIIRSDGVSKYEVLFNKYYKYNDDIYETIHSIKEKINNTKDLKTFSKYFIFQDSFVCISNEPFPNERLLEVILII